MKKLLLTILISTSLIGTASALTFSNNNTSKQSNNDTSKQSSSSNGIDRFGLISEIPEPANPNYETLKFYLYRYLYSHNIYPYCGSGNKELHCENSSPYHAHLVESSDNPYQFHSDLREDNYIKKQMQESALLSYLLYEDGKIVIDEITPKDRFGDMFRDSSKFHSQSVGKTLVSYVAGHAICEGYIKSVDSRLDDWPVLENTLYHNQKLIDVLNMAAGTQKYFDGANRFTNSARSVTTPTVQEAMENELKGSKKAFAKYNYVNMNPILVISYILYKSGDDNFKQLLEDVFQKKARIKGDVFFLKNEDAAKDDISVWNQFYATRYDYLRIAKAMLDDWQNDTCVGKYLKTIHERRIPKNGVQGTTGRVGMPRSYGGFFHTGYKGMNNRPVMGMDGYGGQSILIDFERERIVATQAIHDNMKFPKPGSYDWKKIVYERIKNGKPASGGKQLQEPVIDPQQIILEQKANKETEKNAKEYWDDYYEAMDEKLKGIISGASADGSTMFSEDFENLDQRELRVVDRDKKWNIIKDNDSNSIYCNKVADNWTEFNFGSGDWKDYSISYRMKFFAGKAGRVETHIRKTQDGDYRVIINNLSGHTNIDIGHSGGSIASGMASTKADEWSEIKLIASGNNILYLVNGKLVASAKDDEVKKGSGMIAVSGNSKVCVDDIVINKVPVSEALELEDKLKNKLLNKIKSSDAFDERYSFNILRQGALSTKIIGSGYIEINNGIMTVAKDGRTINVDSVDLYDSFEGRIDKKGNISARFTMYPMCGAFRLQDLEFNGNINAQLKTKCGDSTGFDLYALLELKKEQ